MSEHAVIVDFKYGRRDLAELFALEAEVKAAIEKAGAGEYDGNEVAVDGSVATLFMYGPNADALFSAVAPVLRSSIFMRGARVLLRYGPPEDGVDEREWVLE